MAAVLALLVFAPAQAGSASATKPADCRHVHSQADWYQAARKPYDGKRRGTKRERRALKHVGACQRNRTKAARRKLRKARQGYRRGHLRRLYRQGIGKFNRVYPAHGLYESGAFIRFRAVRRIFEAAEATPREAYVFATIVRGESGGGKMGGYPGILGIDGWVVPGATSVGIGLAQTTPAVWCCAATQRLAQLGGPIALRNPLVNAVMSYFLYQAAGNSWSPWYGTAYMHDPGPIRSALTKADRRWLRAGGMLRLRTT